ncbi:hypothetical protein HQ487_01770 [Candidatus Uhrbacteria bacterium]|nr:hypothetical protein [Candidatus Uhrbacteria bacterium]
MPIPTQEEYVKARLRYAEHFAKAEWQMKYGDPQRARETARAWVGIIQLEIMGSSENYARTYSSPYKPPQTGVVPASAEISLSGELGFSIRYLPSGSPFRFSEDHILNVQELFDDLTISPVTGEQYTRQTTFPEDRILVTWSTQAGPLFNDGTYPIPFNVFLLKPDGSESETSRVTTRIVAGFPTEEEAQGWTQARSNALRTEHDRNHAKKCDDKACTRRDHTYEPRHDD